MAGELRMTKQALPLLLLLAACGAAEDDAKQGQLASPPEVANAAAPPAPAREPTRDSPFSSTGYALNGTKPFWGGTVTGTSIRYMTPENQFGDVVDTRLSFAPGREVYRGTLGGRPFVLTLSRGPCSDDMSDRAYVFSAILEVRGETRCGCADPQ